MSKVFIVNGQGGSGKTTFEDFVAEACEGDVAVVSMIDYTKQCAAKLGWNGAKDEKDRRFLSNLKDALTAWDDSPFLTTCAMARMAIKEGCDIVFIDAREPNDIDRLKETFNCYTILIKRGEQKDYGNHADNNVFNYNYNIIIKNNGTIDELHTTAEEFVKVVKGEKHDFNLLY